MSNFKCFPSDTIIFQRLRLLYEIIAHTKWEKGRKRRVIQLLRTLIDSCDSAYIVFLLVSFVLNHYGLHFCYMHMLLFPNPFVLL